MSASAASGRVQAPALLGAGARVGQATVTAALRRTAIAEVYQADVGGQPVTLWLIQPQLAQQPAIRDAVVAAARAAIALGEQKHLVRTLDVGVDGDRLYVLTEPQDGNSVKDLLARKRQSGAAGGLPARGAGNLVVGVAAALAAAGVHGGLSTESVIVSRNGRVRVCDLAVGAGLAAACAAGAVPAPSHVAPELTRGAAPSEAADVYGLGALLYEALVGRPLERGGPRPSEAVAGLTTTVDELIARMCAADPAKRFGSVAVVQELVADALSHGAAVDDGAATPSPSHPSQSGADLRRPSLAQAIAQPSVSAQHAAVSPSAASLTQIDPALAAALADTNEKWLVVKGRLDYGPFSLQQIFDQIQSGDIVAGNIIVDKDTGGRADVGEHPLLGPMVDAARQRRDDARRAHAEVHHQTKEKKRHVVLYTTLALAVIGVGVGLYFIVGGGGKQQQDEVAGVAKVGGAQLAVKLSEPKPPEKKKPSGGSRSGGSRSGGGGGGDDSEDLSFDMSGDDEDGSERLDMNTIYGVYSRYGGQLGSCVSRSGESYASIGIIIDGKSGKVTWVKVNGQKSGGLYDCINRVMRSMSFPTINGPRTRAEFDISL